MSSAINEFIAKCEQALREGNGELVAQYFTSIELKEISRPFALPVANIARRAGLLPVGLKILTPLVRPTKGIPTANSKELAEYAVLLERSGAPQEALRVLSQVNTGESPEAHLYRVFCHFKSWDYRLAIPELENYLAADLTPYQQLIANVNLAAALVTVREYDQGLFLLEKNIQTAESSGYARLNANCHELRAQVHYHHGNYAAALRDLLVAENIFGADKTSDKFFVQKWQSIIKGEVAEWRKLAVERRDWESVREADLFQLIAKPNEEALKHLYFGSPFAAYRTRVETYVGRRPNADHYLLGRSEDRCFDLQTGLIQGAESINPGKKMHQLIGILLSDLYQPWRIAALFAKLYPDEHFNIFSSPARVHQVIFRARQWLFENSIPVNLIEENHAYRLQIEGAFSFRLHVGAAEISGPEAQWNRLTSGLNPQQPFTAKEARAVLNMPVASTKRLLTWALDNGRAERRGENRSSVYHLKKAA